MNEKANDGSAFFRETQRFRQPWVWGIVLLPMAIVLGILLYQLITGEPVGDRPASNGLLFLLLFLIPIPIAVGFYVARLTTRIDGDGFGYGWNILSSKLNRYRWSDLDNVSLIRYRFVGYGLRYTRTYGLVHNVSGNLGLMVETKGGRKFTVGTVRPDELDDAMREIARRHPNLTYTDARNVKL